MLLPKELKEKMLTKYTLSSLMTMSTQLGRFHTYFGKKKFTKSLLENFEKVVEFIESISAKITSSRKNCLNTIVQTIKFSNPNFKLDKYNIFLKKLAKVHEDAYQLKKPTESDIENAISIAEIIRRRELYKDATCTSEFRKYVILSIYSYIPPLRSQDWYSIRLNNLNYNKFNWYDQKKGILHISDYKTKKTYGKREIQLPIELQNILTTWITQHRNTEYLFTDSFGNQASRSTFSCYLKEAFYPNKMGSQLLRKQYISEVVPTLSSDERKKLKNIMAHSLIMQALIYSKKEISDKFETQESVPIPELKTKKIRKKITVTKKPPKKIIEKVIRKVIVTKKQPPKTLEYKDVLNYMKKNKHLLGKLVNDILTPFFFFTTI